MRRKHYNKEEKTTQLKKRNSTHPVFIYKENTWTNFGFYKLPETQRLNMSLTAFRGLKLLKLFVKLMLNLASRTKSHGSKNSHWTQMTSKMLSVFSYLIFL